jgi:ribosomal protein S18 acetylase RimI-like enzyme
MEELAASAEIPWRVTNVRDADDHVPPRWRRAQVRRWHWMLTETAPAPAVCEVEEVSQSADLNRLLDQANDGSYARPGAPGIECWLGVRREGLLLGAGALMRLPSSAGHVRGIAVLEQARRQGIGTAVSAELTRRGLANGSPVCTLGVYTHNAAAIAMYRRLGYDVVHTFTSGEVPSPE